MNALAISYAKASYELIESGKKTTEVLQLLDTLLKRKGHAKLKPAILRALSRIASESKVSDTPVLTVANENHVKILKSAIENALKTFGIASDYRIKIDPTVIGGYRLMYKGEQIDATYKKSLLTLYRNITN